MVIFSILRENPLFWVSIPYFFLGCKYPPGNVTITYPTVKTGGKEPNHRLQKGLPLVEDMWSFPGGYPLLGAFGPQNHEKCRFFKPPKYGSQPLKIKVSGFPWWKLKDFPPQRVDMFFIHAEVTSSATSSPHRSWNSTLPLNPEHLSTGRRLSWTDASWWLNQPILKNMLVKMDHLPLGSGWTSKIFETEPPSFFCYRHFFGDLKKREGSPQKWAFREEIEETSFGDIYGWI